MQQIEISSWPSRDYRPVAVLRLEPEELACRLGIQFREDVDDLDYLKYAGLLLSVGEQILLLRYRRAPSQGTDVCADAGADPRRVLHAFLRETGLTRSDLRWWPGPKDVPVIVPWPRGDCWPVAVLRLEPAELSRRLEIAFTTDQDNLRCFASHLLSTTDQVLLLGRLDALNLGTEMYTDACYEKYKTGEVLRRFLEEAGIPSEDVVWSP